MNGWRHALDSYHQWAFRVTIHTSQHPSYRLQLAYICVHRQSDSIMVWIHLRLHASSPEKKTCTSSPFFSGFAYLIFAMCLAIKTSGDIKARLREAGYTQRRSLAGMLDLLLNFILCWIVYRWMTKSVTTGDHGVFVAFLQAYMSGVILWLSLFLLLLGPTLWFTERRQ